MAIKSTNITLDGLVHTLDDRDRVAAQLVNENANTYTGVNTFSGGLTHTVGQIRRSPGYLVADAAPLAVNPAQDTIILSAPDVHEMSSFDAAAIMNVA